MFPHNIYKTVTIRELSSSLFSYIFFPNIYKLQVLVITKKFMLHSTLLSVVYQYIVFFILGN